jgi:hypothetical protein
MSNPIVECYSGHTYAQEPRALVWQGQRHSVARVERRWRTPEGPAFWVRTESEVRFELQYRELEDRWTVLALPKTDREGAKRAKVLDFPSRSPRPDGSKMKDKEVQN